uniref:Proteinase inhibitor I42 chagasin domain-containing protein n=1 Tax=Neobodo designis TaxID=312471 RepID=A0A7S1M517_NEODS|mmetsp:Transcript_34003/g.104967  ORF Transcript_34003/g.104967 Transcript_34003/m.104967 type:complete len:109 (+) Transcript_34003:58-384(+)|eukprot:CAMPEP_0174840776 /NCGR_PEP_ID=MMETSP1114-20130205/8898_1 /TAXON_ID=312471 /ORGANISM="Neobodo designis, Strain CCAP 1951/1" /LENGTH=108 /DNA_ID=CAMNT_0016074943 /DNA_START=57 /DNA_END=383 /DNA_ORIENTATION=+
MATHNIDPNGGQLDVKVGDTIVFEAEANPTTGYSWLWHNVPTNLEQLENETIKGAGIGAPGKQRFVWRVAMKDPNTTSHEIRFDYARQWEVKDPATQLSKAVVVNVSE